MFRQLVRTELVAESGKLGNRIARLQKEMVRLSGMYSDYISRGLEDHAEVIGKQLDNLENEIYALQEELDNIIEQLTSFHYTSKG